MRLSASLFAPLLAGALLASNVAAQACVGLPSFEGRPMRVNVAGEFPDSAKAYAVGVGLGRPRGVFGNAGAGQVSLEGMSEKGTFGFMELGWQVPAGPIEVCPIVGGFYQVGPNEPAFGLEAETKGGSAGAAVGLPLAVGFGSVIPNVGLRYEYASQTVEEEGFDPADYTFKSSLLELGLAFVLVDRISVQPIVRFPLSGDDEETRLGVFASLAFGVPR